MQDKQHIINKMYFDRSDHISKKIILQDAKKINKTIEMFDIDDF